MINIKRDRLDVLLSDQYSLEIITFKVHMMFWKLLFLGTGFHHNYCLCLYMIPLLNSRLIWRFSNIRCSKNLLFFIKSTATRIWPFVTLIWHTLTPLPYKHNYYGMSKNTSFLHVISRLRRRGPEARHGTSVIWEYLFEWIVGIFLYLN